MSTADELMFSSVVELRDMLSRREVSSVELVEASLSQVERFDVQLNSFVDLYADEALQLAARIESDDPRPLAGIPVGVKNNTPVAGHRLAVGSAFGGQRLATYDYSVVRKLKEAGAIMVGATNLPEWAIVGTSEPRAFGAVRNPWDLTRTAGGSSGGSAAAVAAGLVPLATASDGAGSIRIPAACCGLVGLKPQRGRVSQGPHVGGLPFVADGVVTRTVEDNALLLDVLSGYETGDAWWAPAISGTFHDAVASAPRRLRIGMTSTPAATMTAVAPETEACLRAAADVLVDLGHEVVEVDPPWQQEGLGEELFDSLGALCMQYVLEAAEHEGRLPEQGDMEALSWYAWERSALLSSRELAATELKLQGVGRRVVAWASDFDVVMTPTLSEPPVRLGTIATDSSDPRGALLRSLAFAPFTPISNITGSPAITVPAVWYEASQQTPLLPFGLELIGQPAGEELLLSLAREIEVARPWIDRRPQL